MAVNGTLTSSRAQSLALRAPPAASSGLSSPSALPCAVSNPKLGLTCANVSGYLAKGIIVLIAIAIATGLVFLLVLLGILLAFCLRKRDDSNYPVAANAEKDDSSADHHVFHNVQTAVERSFAPAAAAGAVGAAHKRASDETEYTLGDQAMMAGDGEDDDYEGRETIMRYDFEGDDAQPGELTVNAGERIVVIDDVQVSDVVDG
jgi:hypothetical protein